jgi:putative transposase
MPRGLHRYQQTGDLHFLTFSCYQRLAYLRDHGAANQFESSLEAVRRRYGMAVLGYVVMPEHVHLLVNEPKGCRLDRAIQAVKISVSRRRPQRPFWQARYYDFNVHSAEKTTEKLKYLHRNPVARRLVSKPEEWPWSSYRHYQTGIEGTVQIESFWTAWRREHGGELAGCVLQIR